jgi:ADP-ribosylglycohydrolase
MQGKGETMVFASFVGDSLALGAHWIYDAGRIAREFGRVEQLLKPREDSYHPTKDQGECTHYGDQMFVLLQSVAAMRGFDLLDFFQRWQDLFRDYKGYYDGATKGTIRNIAKGKGPEGSGSPSNDLAGAARIAPLLYCYRNDLDSLVRAVTAQTKMTHTDPATIDSAEFFARVTFRTLGGALPTAAIREVAKERYPDSTISEWVQDGFDSHDMESVAAIGKLGQSCHSPDAFPAVVHLIVKYERNLREALIQSVMAGGDSAARGILVGMVLGAYLGKGSLPEEWIAGLKKGEEIKSLLHQLR